MKALWLDRDGLGVCEIPLPRQRADSALIEVHQAGVCGTDLALADGMYDFTGVPGHEFVGTVVKGPHGWKGRRVVADINVACGRCRFCRNRQSKHCANRRVVGIRAMHGAFAQFVAIPLANLHVVPARLDDDAAVFAEPLAAALDACAHVDRKSRVLVVGPGRLGQLVVRVLLARRQHVHALGRGAQAIARLPRPVDAADCLPTSWQGRFDAVIECSGSAAGIQAALLAVRPRGTVVLKSTCNGSTPIDLARVVVDEVSLRGSRCGNLRSALHWLNAGRVDPRPLITSRRLLDDGIEALDDAASPAHIKVLLTP